MNIIEQKRKALAIAEKVFDALERKKLLSEEYEPKIKGINSEIEALQKDCPHPNDKVIWGDPGKIKDHTLQCCDCLRQLPVEIK